MGKRAISTAICVCCLWWLMGLTQEGAWPVGRGFTQYTDPGRRFILDYPATMKVEAENPDQVIIYHPNAALRISVFVEKRPRKAPGSADSLLRIFKKNLKESMADVSILEEGKLPGLGGSQGYIICAFTNKKGLKLVQLVQYYVTEDRTLQLTISDRPEGFKNLANAIREIHRSLRIVDPQLR